MIQPISEESVMAISTDLQNNLRMFTGTEFWYQHPLNKKIYYTEGVKYFCKTTGAYWFLDALVPQPEILKQAETFAHIILSVSPEHIAKISVNDGDVEVFSLDNISTDCPVGNWEFYFYNNVVLLPSEY
jgi:hypothetical protein